MAQPVDLPDRAAATTSRIIDRLQRGYLAGAPEAATVLAQLRRTDGTVARLPAALWPAVDLTALGLPTEDGTRPNDDAVRAAEDATVLATVLWALHQHSSTTPMHRTAPADADGPPSWLGLGGALRRLAATGTGPTEYSLLARLTAARTSLPIPAPHLTYLVRMLATAGIPLDYAHLSWQLTRWPMPGGRTDTSAQWARSWWRTTPRRADRADASPARTA